MKHSNAVKTAAPQPDVLPALIDLRKIIRQHERPSPVKAHTVELTPDLAAEFLKRNVNVAIEGRETPLHNRKINNNNVAYLQRQIENDLMLNTGEPLIFTKEGWGIDLQHRCEAVVRSGKGYVTTVLTGVDIDSNNLPDVLLVMGQAAKRTAQQLSAMVGVKTQVWDTVRYYELPYDAKSGTMEITVSRLELNNKLDERRSFYEGGLAKVLALFNADSSNASELGRNRIPTYAAAYLKMTDIDPTLADKFMTAFLSKTNMLPKGNPVDELRTQLTRVFDKGVRDRAKPLMVREVMLAAFGDFIEYEKNGESGKWNYNLVGKKRRNVSASGHVKGKRPYHRRPKTNVTAPVVASESNAQTTSAFTEPLRTMSAGGNLQAAV